MLIVDLDGKALEELIADQARDVVETFYAAREIAEIERRENLRSHDNAADFERIDFRHAHILLGLADARAAQGAFGLQAEFPGHARLQNVGAARIEQHE